MKPSECCGAPINIVSDDPRFGVEYDLKEVPLNGQSFWHACSKCKAVCNLLKMPPNYSAADGGFTLPDYRGEFLLMEGDEKHETK